ncbi:hypothetical protein [Pectobacterium carotovorum]|uniref:Uncharacterized protein n=1 Tax=Pectobacterium carotovorum subsp. carotovorum (strain PC1) TaxID=561230 RepID=C6DC95_PECCP|nr:hypothetical protein [Pectobacterium carotovorum]ACT14189.1 hypothetical protein PC1_3166 [Pectobacterium carotovorum subsp. carotovorum PC1]
MHQLTREVPKFTLRHMKLAGVIQRLQNIMVKENITPDELVSCSEAVRDSQRRIDSALLKNERE